MKRYNDEIHLIRALFIFRLRKML